MKTPEQKTKKQALKLNIANSNLLYSIEAFKLDLNKAQKRAEKLVPSDDVDAGGYLSVLKTSLVVANELRILAYKLELTLNEYLNK